VACGPYKLCIRSREACFPNSFHPCLYVDEKQLGAKRAVHPVPVSSGIYLNMLERGIHSPAPAQLEQLAQTLKATLKKFTGGAGLACAV
jgi:hypothetical protein